MKKLLLLISLVSLNLIADENWKKKTFERSSINIPKSWVENKPTNSVEKLLLTTKDKRITFVLMSVTAPEFAKTDYLLRFKKLNLKRHNSELISYQKIKLNGQNGYLLKHKYKLRGHMMFKAQKVIIENNTLYQLDASKVGKDPLENSEAQTLFDSFRLTKK